MRFLWITVFGLTGVFSRYFVDSLAARWIPDFPAGTLFINLTGSFFAGIVYVFGAEKQLIPVDLRVGLLVGLLGGYTTFSAYALQSGLMLKGGRFLPGLVYFGISPVLGLAAVLAGMHVARAMAS